MGKIVKAGGTMAQKTASAGARVASSASKVIGSTARTAGSALGPVGAILGAGLEFNARKEEGQTNTQAAIGTAGTAAGAGLGAWGGAATGAAIGSIVPGVGTVIGGVVGGLVGGLGGGWLGGKAADKATGADNIGDETAVVEDWKASLEKTDPKLAKDYIATYESLSPEQKTQFNQNLTAGWNANKEATQQTAKEVLQQTNPKLLYGDKIPSALTEVVDKTIVNQTAQSTDSQEKKENASSVKTNLMPNTSSISPEDAIQNKIKSPDSNASFVSAEKSIPKPDTSSLKPLTEISKDATSVEQFPKIPSSIASVTAQPGKAMDGPFSFNLQGITPDTSPEQPAADSDSNAPLESVEAEPEPRKQRLRDLLPVHDVEELGLQKNKSDLPPGVPSKSLLPGPIKQFGLTALQSAIPATSIIGGAFKAARDVIKKKREEKEIYEQEQSGGDSEYPSTSSPTPSASKDVFKKFLPTTLKDFGKTAVAGILPFGGAISAIKSTRDYFKDNEKEQKTNLTGPSTSGVGSLSSSGNTKQSVSPTQTISAVTSKEPTSLSPDKVSATESSKDSILKVIADNTKKTSEQVGKLANAFLVFSKTLPEALANTSSPQPVVINHSSNNQSENKLRSTQLAAIGNPIIQQFRQTLEGNRQLPV